MKSNAPLTPPEDEDEDNLYDPKRGTHRMCPLCDGRGGSCFMCQGDGIFPPTSEWKDEKWDDEIPLSEPKNIEDTWEASTDAPRGAIKRYTKPDPTNIDSVKPPAPSKYKTSNPHDDYSKQPSHREQSPNNNNNLDVNDIIDRLDSIGRKRNTRRFVVKDPKKIPPPVQADQPTNLTSQPNRKIGNEKWRKLNRSKDSFETAWNAIIKR